MLLSQASRSTTAPQCSTCQRGRQTGPRELLQKLKRFSLAWSLTAWDMQAPLSSRSGVLRMSWGPCSQSMKLPLHTFLALPLLLFIAHTSRWGVKPDGVCVVVGTMGAGFARNTTGDVIATIDDLSPRGLQYFWEVRDCSQYPFTNPPHILALPPRQ